MSFKVVIPARFASTRLPGKALSPLHGEPMIWRHDALDLDDVERIAPDGILISPGPGTPDDAGLSNVLIAEDGSVTILSAGERPAALSMAPATLAPVPG